MKVKINENSQSEKLKESANKKKVSDYIVMLEENIRDEMEAIEKYESALKLSNLPADARSVITEIKEDEIDHLTMLSLLLEKATIADFGVPEEFSELTGEKIDTLVEEGEEEENLKESKERKPLSETKHYRGCPEIEFVYHGNWSDPELIYKGKSFNYWDIEEALWEDFLEETGHIDDESDVPEVEEEFSKYVCDHGPDYLEDVIFGGYFGDEVENDEDE